MEMNSVSCRNIGNSFLGSAETLIRANVIKKIKDDFINNSIEPHKIQLHKDYSKTTINIYEPPLKGHAYIVGADPSLGAESDYHIGLYGRLKLEYMKKHQLGLYSDLILNGTLPEYLIEIDKTSNERAKSIINELAKNENVDENLKQNNQLEWVRCMNNIKNRAEEIVLNG